MNVRLFAGDDALAYIASDGFETQWRALHARCPWATGCQHPDFVLPWYRIYGRRYVPVVLVEFAADGSLTGLLTLALSLDEARLTGAGGVQAEYQGWIAAGPAAGGFVLRALERLRIAFPLAHVGLRYLPPGIPLDWIDDDASVGKRCVLRSHARPVMHTGMEAMDRQRRKKNHRQNFNRLGRLGTVAFEHVTDHARFVAVFDEICRQYDFRQAALHRQMPFTADPLKKPFYLELHRRGLLHVAILTVGDEVVASHLGVLSKERTVHLGINTHAPAFAAHSPGHLLLAQLGVQLAAEQMDLLDLTPGGDAYKEQFASAHDQVFELDIFSGMVSRLKGLGVDNLRCSAKAVLRKTGLQGRDVRAAVRNVTDLGWLDPRRFVARLRLRSARAVWVCPVERHAAHPGRAPLPIAKNALGDVFKYDDAGASLKLGAFIGQAMKRLENACQLYSFAPDDKLVVSCWAQAGSASDEVVLSGLYVHQHLGDATVVQRFIEQLLAELGSAPRAMRVLYRGHLPTDMRAVVRRCGFSEARASGSDARGTR